MLLRTIRAKLSERNLLHGHRQPRDAEELDQRQVEETHAQD